MGASLFSKRGKILFLVCPDKSNKISILSFLIKFIISSDLLPAIVSHLRKYFLIILVSYVSEKEVE
jgi:hypothetical protein